MYTIDDICEAVRRAEVQKNLNEGGVLFYIHMAYAMGMGFQPSDWAAKLAELKRSKSYKIFGVED